MAKYGIVVQKKEMTKMWIDNAFTAVTVVTVPQQEVLRYKKESSDGYTAMVV
jgi:ribosomal protein L3